VHLAAPDVHSVGDRVREFRRDRPDLAAYAAEVVEEPRPLRRQLVEERGQLEDIDVPIIVSSVPDELTELLSRLVAIDSVNPDLVAGGAGEGEIARFVADWLEGAGLEVESDEVARGRWNVVGRARGSGGGKALMLNAHMDTVGVAGMDAPFDPRIADGRLYARGAYDMKASLAAIMLTGARARELGLRGDVIVTAVADEEVASVGSVAVAERLSADAAIVAEPTELRLAIAHRGFVWVEVETEGRAAHGSRPDLGVDAIARMGRVLVGIEELDRRLRSDPSHPLLGSGSVHASLIEGGQELSSYPGRCLLKAERRTITGETPERVEAEFRELLADTEGSVRAMFSRGPFEVGTEEPIVEAVRRHASEILGSEPETVGVPFWTDAAVLADAGIPTLLFGPAGEGAHAVVEWVDLESAGRCAEIYLAVAREFCA
jgi:acetylornithine deacetylase/succinyl-diaminopimelate desuccinylase-like protein